MVIAFPEEIYQGILHHNDLDLIGMFVDDGKKSYTFDRPDYIELEKFIKKHKSAVQYLIVLDHDRFSRNLPEAFTKIEYLEKKHGLKVLATSEPLNLDTSNPMVFMQRTFKYMVAQPGTVHDPPEGQDRHTTGARISQVCTTRCTIITKIRTLQNSSTFKINI